MEMTRDALLAVIVSSKQTEEPRKEKEVDEKNGRPGSEGGEPGAGSVGPGRREKLDETRDDPEEGQEMGLSEILTQVLPFSQRLYAVLTVPRNRSHPHRRHELYSSARYLYLTI